MLDAVCQTTNSEIIIKKINNPKESKNAFKGEAVKCGSYTAFLAPALTAIFCSRETRIARNTTAPVQ